MTIHEIEARMQEIKTELELEDVDIKTLSDEFDELKAERQVYVDNEKRKNEILEEIVEEPTKINIITKKEEKMEMNYIDTPEYRNAFLKNLLGEEMTEAEKRAFVHTTENTEAVIPTELQNKIYTNMQESHPILGDVQYLRTGAVISIVKHTEIVAGDAKAVAEGVANDDEQNTFVSVALSGKDFSKHVDFSYRLGKMAIPAFENYLVQEIGARLASALAADVVAQMKTDINAGNKISTTALVKEDVLKALGALKEAGEVVVYANNQTIYGNIITMGGAEGMDAFIPDYQNGISGRLFGKAIKREDALADGEILIVDPNQFIMNEVQPLLIERDRNIKTHVHTISGLIIAGGVLTNDKAGALVTVSAGA